MYDEIRAIFSRFKGNDDISGHTSPFQEMRHLSHALPFW